MEYNVQVLVSVGERDVVAGVRLAHVRSEGAALLLYVSLIELEIVDALGVCGNLWGVVVRRQLNGCTWLSKSIPKTIAQRTKRFRRTILPATHEPRTELVCGLLRVHAREDLRSFA